MSVVSWSSRAGQVNPIAAFRSSLSNVGCMQTFSSLSSFTQGFQTTKSLSPPLTLSPNLCLPPILLVSFSRHPPCCPPVFIHSNCFLFCSLLPHITYCSLASFYNNLSISVLTFPLPPLMHIWLISFIRTDLSWERVTLAEQHCISAVLRRPSGDCGIETCRHVCMLLLPWGGREFLSVKEFF